MILSLWRALHAEQLKLKGTLALAMCLIAPATVIVLNTLMALVRTPAGNAVHEMPYMMWAMINYSLWAILMLPLFITLQSALLAGLEHGNHQWKHLLALPLPKSVHFTVKWLVLWLMNAAASLILMLLIPASGWMLDLMSSNVQMTGPVPWQKLLLLSLQIGIASSLMVGIHTAIALRWQSFTVASASGMVATVAGFLIAQSSRFGHFYPWALPVQIFTNPPKHLEFALWFGGIGGLICLVFGAWFFSHRETA